MKHDITCTRRLMVPTLVLIILGVFLVWASQSYYAFFWAQARAAFPGEGVRVVMVNADLSLRAKYLPEEYQNQLGLNAVVVDNKDQARALIHRDGALCPYPEGKDRLDYTCVFFRVYAWREACLPIGTIVLGATVVQCVILISCWVTCKRNELDR